MEEHTSKFEFNINKVCNSDCGFIAIQNENTIATLLQACQKVTNIRGLQLLLGLNKGPFLKSAKFENFD